MYKNYHTTNLDKCVNMKAAIKHSMSVGELAHLTLHILLKGKRLLA